MKDEEVKDEFLEKRLTKYDDWIGKGQISFSSKVVPVSESLKAQQWVLPGEQAMEILRGARSVALQKCICRENYKRCDKPLEVCIVLNEAGEKFVAKGQARPVSLSEAADVLRKADESGLVHLSLYMPDHEVFALCSCCACCCHDLQILKRFERKDLVVRSEYPYSFPCCRLISSSMAAEILFQSPSFISLNKAIRCKGHSHASPISHQLAILI